MIEQTILTQFFSGKDSNEYSIRKQGILVYPGWSCYIQAVKNLVNDGKLTVEQANSVLIKIKLQRIKRKIKRKKKKLETASIKS